MDRNLDGVYFRVKRGEKWENVCFSDLTKEQMEEVIKNKNSAFLQSLCVILGQCIKAIGDQFDLEAVYEENRTESRTSAFEHSTIS